MAIKFSQFTEKVDPSNVDGLVGYYGNENIRISVSNLIPSGGSSVIDRVNENRLFLKDQYIQGVFNGLDATTAQVGQILDNAVNYDSNPIGIVTDIFDTSSYVTNTTNVTVNPQSPVSGFGNIQLQQDILPYGTDISEKALERDVFAFWQANGVSRVYENNEYSIFSYMYSPDGTKVWAFAKNNYGNSYYVTVIVEFDLSTPFDVTSRFFEGNAVIEHEDNGDQQFGISDANGDEFNIHYDPELNVVRLTGRGYNNDDYIFVEYQVTGQSITGVNRIISSGDSIDRITNFDVGSRLGANGTFNGDGTKFLAAEFYLFGPYELIVSTYDVSVPFSTNSSDFTNTDIRVFELTSNYSEFPSWGFISQNNCPLVRVNQAGDELSVYQVVETDKNRLYSFKISLNDFVVDSNSQIIGESSFDDYSSIRDLPANATLVHSGDLIVSNNRGRFSDLNDFSSWYYIELNVIGLGDIQAPGSFERSIDLTNDLDSPPTSLLITKQDNSSDANVTMSVDISDGTNTVTINSLDTEVDCSALTSRTLTAIWNLSVLDVQGTNAKIENYALNFR